MPGGSVKTAPAEKSDGVLPASSLMAHVHTPHIAQCFTMATYLLPHLRREFELLCEDTPHDVV